MYNTCGAHSNSNSAGMRLDYMSDDKTLETLWLPKQPEGRFFFRGSEENDVASAFYVEGNGETWRLHCKKGAYVNTIYGLKTSASLSDKQFVVISCGEKEGIVYAETLLERSNVYYNYEIRRLGRIRIGREADNDIQYIQNVVTRHHAAIWWNGERWMITDHNSMNGTYLNGKRISEAALSPGDTVYIVGLRIVMGYGFLSINSAGRNVILNREILIELQPKGSKGGIIPVEAAEQEEDFFNRSPRRRISMVSEPIQIESPPMSMNANKIPLLLRMGSSAVMGGRALIAGQVTMLLSSFIFPLLSNRYSEKERKEYEEKRSSMYSKYLTDKRREIETERARELYAMNTNYPALDSILEYPISGERLWERQNTDDDFLSLRVGYGRLPLQAELDYADKRFSLEEDELEKSMYRLCETDFFLENAPIMSSFTEDWICGVNGSRAQVLTFIRNIVLQLTILHSYDEVKTVFLISPEELKKLGFIRFLPHIWNDSRNFRFLATNISEAYKIGEYLKNELEEDMLSDQPPKRISRSRPYYFIFALDKKILDSVEMIKSAVQLEYNIGLTLLSAFDDLPKECTKVFSIDDDSQGQIIFIKQLERAVDRFSLDQCDSSMEKKALRSLFNTSLRILSNSCALPKTVSFLDMFGVGRVEHLNVLDRWRNSNPIKSLSTPVGVGTDGNAFTMDLHEKFQGPHGLVAGMTGSGKSEFLITYILSLAVNYHPDEVAFILIDYKGGGLADAFENKATGIRLPHLMGTITNLDGSAIQRSLLAIESELRRRQRIFKECKEALDKSTMDIYAYQKLYRSGAVSEPLPHLFIISDEFAELKQQQPEFMDKLISAARIGRSLGVHLILATQKPSGVVNDQIRSNTKFRVCLKVQDKSDSMDMLKRPEGAELVDVGRFYLQVGYNEYFAMGQSAWCGAAYEPKDEVVEKKDESVHFIDSLGQYTLTAAPEAPHQKTDRSQLSETVFHLSELAKREGIAARSLWTSPLPNKLGLDDLPPEHTDGSMAKLCLGLLDDPENQQQFPFVFDFRHCGNLLIVGEAASGKTTLIQTILYSLGQNASPDEVQFYVLDYSSRLLKAFSVLPHCGAVLTEDDSAKLPALSELLDGLLAERKKLFTQLEVDSFDSACAAVKLPLILLVIDGISGLGNSNEGAAVLQGLQHFLRESTNYGIKCIISCTHLNEVNSRIRQELGDRLCFHMNDKYSYSEALSCRVSYLPPEKPGRGLYRLGESPLELQCAICSSEGENIRDLKDSLGMILNSVTSTTSARKLPQIPEDISYSEFIEEFKPGRIPLGYSVRDAKPVAFPLAQLSGLSLYFGNEAGIIPIWKNLAEAANMNHMETLIMPQKGGGCIDPQWFDGECEELECNTDSITALYNRLFHLIDGRKTLAAAFCAESGTDPDSESGLQRVYDYVRSNTSPIILIIEKFEELCQALEVSSDDDPDSRQKQAASMVLEAIFKMAGNYNIYVIGGFYPGCDQSIRVKPVYRALNVDENIMMFGGRGNEQPFGIYDNSVVKLSEKRSVHLCIMKYKDRFYELYIPCEEPKPEMISEDKMNIFE